MLLTNGFVLVADPGKVDHGERRLRKLLESPLPVELAARHRWLPYEEIASAAVIREVPARASVTLHDGRELTLQER